MRANFRPAQEDRGPLFPGSSCFPLSPDHKHKSGDSVDGSDGVRWMRKCWASGLLKASLRLRLCTVMLWILVDYPSGKRSSWNLLNLHHDSWQTFDPCLELLIIVDDGPRTDYRYHTRGKHDQPETSVFSSMIRSAFFHLKFDGGDFKKWLYAWRLILVRFLWKRQSRPFFSCFISVVVQLQWLLRLNMTFNLLGTPTEAWYDVSLDRSRIWRW